VFKSVTVSSPFEDYLQPAITLDGQLLLWTVTIDFEVNQYYFKAEVQ